jgi:hypothetical protein
MKIIFVIITILFAITPFLPAQQMKIGGFMEIDHISNFKIVDE